MTDIISSPEVQVQVQEDWTALPSSAANDANDLAPRQPHGLFMFPIAAGTKEPALSGDWRIHSTADPAQHDAWRAEGYSLAVDCGKSGLCVIDLDGGPIGETTWAKLQAEHGKAPETYEVRTPKGGRHLYFEGVAPSSVQKLGPKVDTRGAAGYVVREGSTADGTYKVTHDRPIAALPAWVAPALAVSSERQAAAVDELDQPQNIARAVTYLQGLEPVVQAGHGTNSGGADAKTFEVAALLRDFGISAEKSIELMLEHYKCTPQDARYEAFITRKVANAWEYGQNEPGAWAVDSATKVFANYVALFPPEPTDAAPVAGGDTPPSEDETARMLASAPPPPAGQDPETWPRRWLEHGLKFGLKANDLLRPRSSLEFAGRPPRRELVRHWLYERSIMILAAEYGSGKSWIALDTCASLAAGLPAFGAERFTVEEPVQVLYCAGEDAEGMAKERLNAWITHKGLTAEAEAALRSRLRFTEAVPLIKSEKETEKLITWCKHYDFHPKLIVLDTYAKAISGAGSANEDTVATLAAERSERLKAALGASVLILAHVRKAGGGGPTGSQAFPAGADVVWEANHAGNSLRQAGGAWEVTLTNATKNRHGALKDDILLRGQNVRLPGVGEPGLVFVAAAVGTQSVATKRKMVTLGQVGRALVDGGADARLKAKARIMSTAELAELLAGPDRNEKALVDSIKRQLKDNSHDGQRFFPFVHQLGAGGKSGSTAWQYPGAEAPCDPSWAARETVGLGA